MTCWRYPNCASPVAPGRCSPATRQAWYSSLVLSPSRGTVLHSYRRGQLRAAGPAPRWRSRRDCLFPAVTAMGRRPVTRPTSRDLVGLAPLRRGEELRDKIEEQLVKCRLMPSLAHSSSCAHSVGYIGDP